MKQTKVELIPISKVTPDDHQPREYFDPRRMKSLENSLKKYGLRSPIIVEKQANGRYLIEDGERRFRAAKELGWKEIPAILEDEVEKTTRLVRQYDIQEQHENWLPSEKAMAIFRIADETGATVNQIATLLGLNHGQVSRYVALGHVVDKKGFQDAKMPLEWAPALYTTILSAKKVSSSQLKEDFNRDDEHRLENAIFKRVKKGEMTTTRDFTKLKDSFVKDPSSIEAFISTDITPNALFLKTKAQGAYHYRNGINSIGYTSMHFEEWLKTKDGTVSDKDVPLIKRGIDILKKVLEVIE